MSDYDIGKDVGDLRARVEALEVKYGCRCGGQAEEVFPEMELVGKPEETKEEPNANLELDTSIHAQALRCTTTGHLRTTTTPPSGHRRGLHYCQICCIGSGDNGWYYSWRTVNGARQYATRENGQRDTVSCGGRNLINGC